MKKYVFALLLLLTSTILWSQEDMGFLPKIKEQLSSFRGWVTKVPSDKLQSQYTPDMLNVWTDEFPDSITKRRGMTTYLNSALGGSQWVRSLYVYKQVDGDEYMIISSSTSVFYSLGAGESVQIRGDLATNFTPDFTTGNDELFVTSLSTWPWKWDGSDYTVLDNVDNSTGVVKCRYNEYWDNRLWLAGITATPSRIWYSESGAPTEINATNFIDVNISDGDYITALFRYQNRLFVLKRDSTWEIVTPSPGRFIVRNLSEHIGCLYDTTIQQYKDFPIWMSHRSFELYDGRFNLISDPIDDYVKDLSQLVAGRNTLEQDTADDWGAGSGVNIDTTTYSGSVALGRWFEKESDRDWYGIALSSNGITQAAVVHAGQIYISTDTGDTWTAKDSNRNWYGISITDDGSIQTAIVTGGQIYVSTDSGDTWTAKDSNRDWQSISVSATDGSIQTAVVYGGQIYVSTDSGDTWTAKDSNRNWMDVSVSDDGTTQAAVVLGGQIYVSTDSGDTWTAKDSNRDWTAISISGDGVDQTAVGLGIQIYVSRNSGNTWTAKSVVKNWRDVAVASNDANMQVAVAFSDYIYVSEDLGDTWTAENNIKDWWRVEMSYTGDIKTAQVNGGKIYVDPEEASFTSQTQEATAWDSWGNFSVEEIKPTGTTITYYAQAGGVEAAIGSQPTIEVVNGGPINLSTGPYIRIISSYTKTDTNSVPQLNKYSIEYYKETDLYVPYAQVYEERYWCGVSTSPAGNNDLVLVYDTKGEWTKHSMNFGSACVYKNNLYMGDSTDTGQIYRLEVEDTYADNGNTYDSYYTTKVYDFGYPTYEKTLTNIWAVTDHIGSGTLNIDYRKHGVAGDWTEVDAISLDDANDGTIVKKLAITHNPKSYYYQFRVRNPRDEYFRFKRFIFDLDIEEEK